MGDVGREGREWRRRAGARDPEAAPAAAPPMVPAGVSNHLLARALSTANPPAGARLQRVFQFKGKPVPPAKVPRIHGVSATDLQKLADDEDHDYGPITDAASVAAAMLVYEARHRVQVVLPPLDETYKGYMTVWDDDAFGAHLGQPVRVTFQLDSMQGKHDAEFASGKDARKKAGGQQMPWGSDYAALAQGVPATLTRERWTQIFALGAREKLDFAVQKIVQEDGYHYEISAMWAPLGAGRHVLVYYHCYPPY